jgi:hypothetical protein
MKNDKVTQVRTSSFLIHYSVFLIPFDFESLTPSNLIL